jgi:hypothetical protein
LPPEDRNASALLEGKYANFLKVGQNAVEFILEFGQLYQPEETPRMHTRIVTSPVYAREFLRTLQIALDDGDGGPPPPMKDPDP